MTTSNAVCSLVWIALSAVRCLADHNHWTSAMSQASVAKEAGKFSDAERAYDEAVRATEQDPGLAVEHALAIARRASLLHDLQRTREAEKGYLQAMEILRREPPAAVQKQLGPLVISLAALYLEMGQPSKAVSLNIERLIPILESRANLANSYGVLGSVAFAQKRFTDAEAWWQRSVGMCESEKMSVDAAAALSNLGSLRAMKGDHKGAEVYFRRSVAHFSGSVGLEHPRAVVAQANLGHVLYRLGRHKDATEWLAKAHHLAGHWFGSENGITIRLWLDYAEALRRSGRKNEAKALRASVERLPAAVKAALPGRSTVDVLQLGDRRLRK